MQHATTDEVRRPSTVAVTSCNHHAAGSAEPFAKPDHRAKRHGKPKKPSYFHKPRRDEVIGGGFFVFRRGVDTGRIRPGGFPYEHGTIESAQAEAERLASEYGGQYQVFGAVDGDYAVGEVVAVGLDADAVEADSAEGC